MSDKQQDKMKALQELLAILSENPTVADRITITIKPSSLAKGERKPGKK